MGLGRASAEMTVALLFTRGFWAVIAVLVLLGFLIENPVVAIGLGLAIAAGIGWVAWLAYRESHSLPVNGQRVPVTEFQCSRCGALGTLRVERHVQRAPGGTVRWPFVVCRSCGHEEAVPGRVLE
jgi:hypothetical protein